MVFIVYSEYILVHDRRTSAFASFAVLQLYAALLMFRADKLSAGAAAEFADEDRFTFAAECLSQRIPVVYLRIYAH